MSTHTLTYWDREIAAWKSTLGDIDALPCTCSHVHQSGQLRRTHEPRLYARSIVCDDCGATLRPLAAAYVEPEATGASA